MLTAPDAFAHHSFAPLMADVVDDKNVGMIERPGRSCFGLEAPQTGGVCDGGLGQHLDGDVAIEPRVACAIHNAHPARVEQVYDLVRPEPGLDQSVDVARVVLADAPDSPIFTTCGLVRSRSSVSSQARWRSAWKVSALT